MTTNSKQPDSNLVAALEKIIEMNRDTARDQHGNADKAESWSCVRVAREAIAAWNRRAAPRAMGASADQQADRQWRAGFLAGWNAGVVGDEAKLKAAQNRVGTLAQYDAAQPEPSREVERDAARWRAVRPFLRVYSDDFEDREYMPPMIGTILSVNEDEDMVLGHHETADEWADAAMSASKEGA
ncbi:hypothetical protein LJR296_001399 [Cupriavidus necator]|uniref:hypothetical protein n=1 Tax=Cupriavidus necator TaxID=106590 RepID=UPI003ECEE857